MKAQVVSHPEKRSNLLHNLGCSPSPVQPPHFCMFSLVFHLESIIFYFLLVIKYMVFLEKHLLTGCAEPIRNASVLDHWGWQWKIAWLEIASVRHKCQIRCCCQHTFELLRTWLACDERNHLTWSLWVDESRVESLLRPHQVSPAFSVFHVSLRWLYGKWKAQIQGHCLGRSLTNWGVFCSRPHIFGCSFVCLVQPRLLSNVT